MSWESQAMADWDDIWAEQDAYDRKLAEDTEEFIRTIDADYVRDYLADLPETQFGLVVAAARKQEPIPAEVWKGLYAYCEVIVARGLEKTWRGGRE